MIDLLLLRASYPVSLRIALVIAVIACGFRGNPRNDGESRVSIEKIDSLVKIRSFKIKEQENLIGSVDGVAISPSGKKMVIWDKGKHACYVVSADGDIENVIKSHYSMLDSLAQYVSFASMAPDSYHVMMSDEVRDAKGRPVSPDKLSSMFPSVFSGVCFEDENHIAIIGTVPVLTQQMREGKNAQVFYSISSLFHYSLDEHRFSSIRPFQMEPSSRWCDVYGGNVTIDHSNNTLVVAYSDYGRVHAGQYDSAYTLARYSLSGSLQQSMMPLPQQYRVGKLNYVFLYLYTDVTSNHDLICAYARTPQIINISKDRRFDLKGIPDSMNNDVFFSQARQNPGINDQELVDNIRMMIAGLYATTRNTIMVTGAWYDSLDTGTHICTKMTWFVQEYTNDGDLIRMRILPQDQRDADIVKYVTYSKSEDALLVFRVSKSDGWMVNCYKWN